MGVGRLTEEVFVAELSKLPLAGRVRVMVAFAKRQRRHLAARPAAGLMTTGEAAHHLDVDVGTVKLWVGRGLLTVVGRRGNRRLIRRAEVLAFERPRPRR